MPSEARQQTSWHQLLQEWMCHDSTISSIWIHWMLDHLRETGLNPGVARICQEDPLIWEYAVSLVEIMVPKGEHRLRDMDNARNKVRVLGKVLRELNKAHDEWKAVNFSFLSGKQYRNVVSAVRSLSQENNSPQFALTAGHYLKQVNLMKISLAIEGENETLKHDAKNFKHLYEASWNLKIPSVAVRCQKFRKINKEQDIPKTKELVMFKDWFCQKLTKARPPRWTDFHQSS